MMKHVVSKANTASPRTTTFDALNCLSVFSPALTLPASAITIARRRTMARIALLFFVPLSLGVTASHAQSPLGLLECWNASKFGGESVIPGLEANDVEPVLSASSIQPPTETGRSTPTISAYSFTPFPTPTQSAVAGVFVPTDPTCPPPVDSDRTVVPDFGPAWAVAYEKAAFKVSP